MQHKTPARATAGARRLTCACLALAVAGAGRTQPAALAAGEGAHRVLMPIAAQASRCAPGPGAPFETVPIEGGTYKDNRLTDENPDVRLSILGFVPNPSAASSLVDYGGPTDPHAPRLHGMFEPSRVPAFQFLHRNHGWIWNENAPPPYGRQDAPNTQWDATVAELATVPGERVHIPERDVPIWSGGNIALVLYAGEHELTLAYGRHDSVVNGYVVHMLGLCVDPDLVAVYRAQLADGRRATRRLPALRNDQAVGVASSDRIIVAVRDVGAFMDPRSRKDWWQGAP